MRPRCSARVLRRPPFIPGGRCAACAAGSTLTVSTLERASNRTRPRARRPGSLAARPRVTATVRPITGAVTGATTRWRHSAAMRGRSDERPLDGSSGVDCERTVSGDVVANPDGHTDRPGRGRSAASAVLLAVAIVAAPLLIVAVWADQQITNTDRYVDAVAGPVRRSPGPAVPRVGAGQGVLRTRGHRRRAAEGVAAGPAVVQSDHRVRCGWVRRRSSQPIHRQLGVPHALGRRQPRRASRPGGRAHRPARRRRA